MNLSRKKETTIIVAIVSFSILLFLFHIGSTAKRKEMALAVALFEWSKKESLGGFLPGNHPALSEQVRNENFSSVIRIPSMISGIHAFRIKDFELSTSIVLYAPNSVAPHWRAKRCLKIGNLKWNYAIGKIDDPDFAQQNN